MYDSTSYSYREKAKRPTVKAKQNVVQNSLVPTKFVYSMYVLSGKFVNFGAREEIFGCLKSLQNSASFKLIKLKNSRTHARKKDFISFQK